MRQFTLLKYLLILLFPICLKAQTNTFPSSGNVGIGTTTPQALLQAITQYTDFRFSTGHLAQTPNMSVINTNSNGRAASLEAGTNGTAFSFDNGGYFAIISEPKSNFLNNNLGTGSILFYMSPTGNVGIGTSTPQEKLSVNGNIVSQKVRVTQSGWADYVFNPSYHLPSLQEVEVYIKSNSHLPDVPTVHEVEKEGLDLGSNQAILLKKIEELTLYVIDQNKRIEKLETLLHQKKEVNK